MKKLLRAVGAVALFVLVFTAAGPAAANHGNEYNPQNNDVIEYRSTTYASVQTAWADPPNYMDPCQIYVINLTASTYKYHPYVWKRSNDTEIWSGSIETLGPDEDFSWTTAGGELIVADIADVHEPYIKVVVSTTGGGYITTITMDPYNFLTGKVHSEYDYESQDFSPC